MFDDLPHFKDWWLQNRPLNTPQDDALRYVGDVHGVVLYRQDPYQVELFITKPNSEIIPHVHPNVDSFEVYVSGDIKFTKDGEVYDQNKLGSSLRVYPNNYHGGVFGERGGCFISIQKWLNGVKPTFVGDDWKDLVQSKSYADSYVKKD